MRTLRYAYRWLIGGIFLLVAVLYLALAPLEAETLQESDKVGHLLAFTVLMVWFCGIFRLRRAPAVALGLLGFGILIELLQSRLAYRSGELADALYDCAGIILGWGLAAAGLGHWAATIESWLSERTS